MLAVWRAELRRITARLKQRKKRRGAIAFGAYFRAGDVFAGSSGSGESGGRSSGRYSKCMVS